MEMASVLNAMKDPMGIPFYPIVFQVLMVLTFALHIIFVNIALGTSFLAFFGRMRAGEHWSMLSRSMTRAVPANVSVAMLIGIAPLLFVQVVYDPFWYASNSLSAAWVIGFVFVMMAAYSLAYVFYFRSEKGKGATAFGILSFALFLLAGVIMHVIGYQLLQPERWLAWYSEGDFVNASGTSLHSFQLPRFLHFIVPSFAVTGIFLMLYAWYFSRREDFDRGYLRWVGSTGAKLAFMFTALQAVVGFWWLFSVPLKFAFFTHPLFLIGAGLGLALLVVLYLAQKDPMRYALPSALGAFLAVFGMSYAREALRMTYLAASDYSIFAYRLSIDLGSTALFLGTFVMGLVIIAYLLSVAFNAGRVSGQYEAGASLHRLGKTSIALLLIWIVLVAGLGVVISVRNYLL